MNPEQELERIEKVRTDLERVRDDAYSEISSAKRRLKEIETTLPGVVLKAALERSSSAPALKMRRELQELRWQIENAQLVAQLIEPLIEQRLKELELEKRKQRRRQERHQAYEALKAQVLESPELLNEFKERDLRTACEYANGDGNTTDADAFIKKIRAKLKKAA